MVLYIVLLLITALIAYTFGSLDSRVAASVFVFRKNLAKLGKGNVWLANFHRVYGIGGWIKLALVEILKDALPVLLGAALLSFKKHGDVGAAFAGFCLVFGSVFPLIYRFKGASGIFTLIAAAMACKSSVGIAVAIVALGMLAALRYMPLAVSVAALAMIIVGVLEIENSLVMILCIMTALLAIIKHIPGLRRMLHAKESKLSFEEDMSYKFDEQF